jgi:hypothetical protein
MASSFARSSVTANGVGFLTPPSVYALSGSTTEASPIHWPNFEEKKLNERVYK